MARSQAEGGIPKGMRRVTIFDQDGNEIQGWIPAENPLVPHPDDGGEIPEFVNVSGKVQNIRFDIPGIDVITVDPWCIVRGSQFRHMAEKTKAWTKDGAPFRERVRGKDKQFSEEYLLTKEQAIADVSRMMGVTFEYGRGRLRDYRDHGKIVNRTEIEDYPLVRVETERDDRADVINAVSDRFQVIDDAEKEVKARGYYV